MEREQIVQVRDVARAVVPLLVEAMHAADRERGRVVLCLSGGSTPLPVYRALADEPRLPWGRTWIAWGDERMVDPDDAERNERAARDALLDRVPVPEDQVLPWPWAPDAPPELCAEAYEARLVAALGDPANAPWFDVTLVGMGEDAHVAGLFPGTGAAGASGLAVASRPPSQPTARLSLTPRALSSSRRLWLLIAGERKRDALRATLEGRDVDRTPGIALDAQDELRAFVDFAPEG